MIDTERDNETDQDRDIEREREMRGIKMIERDSRLIYM